MPQPRVENIEGLSPAVAVEMKETIGNFRSTVGTLTEIYDYLRLLFTRLGTAYCPYTHEKIESVNNSWLREKILSWPVGSKLQLLSPISLEKSETYVQSLDKLMRAGFTRIRLDNQLFELNVQTLQHVEKLSSTRIKVEVIVDRIKAHETESSRIDAAIELAQKLSKGVVIINDDEEDYWINMGFCVPSTGASYPPLSPQLFAFNTDEGACKDCSGIGAKLMVDVAKILPQIDSSVETFLSWLCPQISQLSDCLPEFKKIAKKPLNQLSPNEQRWLLESDPLSSTKKWSWRGLEAIIHHLSPSQLKLFQDFSSLSSMKYYNCLSCGGDRLNPVARNVLINQKNIAQVCQLPLPEALIFVQKLKTEHDIDSTQVLSEVLTQLESRLIFLQQVGLQYLTLDRSAPTLSGGETQRIRLAAQLGAGLSGILYVLDEPSAGLHAQDCLELKKALDQLKSLGNTLVVVDHQPHLIQSADRIYEMGPKAAADGGWVVREGSVKEICTDKNSPTGDFLTKGLVFKKSPRSFDQFIKLRHAKAYELRSIDVDIPLHMLCAITGVSGSGKSTLIEQVLWPLFQQIPKHQDSYSESIGAIEGAAAIDHVCFIDSLPLGLTSRSDVGTYSEVVPKIRELLAQMPEAKAKGLKGGHFSPNVKRGMCRTCYGMGYQSIDLRFMPAVRVVCPQCQGMRLNPVSLEVRYCGYNFGQLLQMNIDELAVLMASQTAIMRRLKTLQDVGLGYLPLGFEAANLSIGEAQRLKLASRLRFAKKGQHTLFLVDEPCKGLHPTDVEHLHATFENLVKQGHSVICIEHQLNFIASCDWLIELGPGAGKNGGQLIATGSPEEVSKAQLSATGKQLHFFSQKLNSPSAKKTKKPLS
jgi:excinuclease ABC subunit A